MPGRIELQQGDFISDNNHNLIYIREAGKTPSGTRKVGVFDLEYQEYFEASLNDLRRNHTRHSYITSYQLRSKKQIKWNPGEKREICGQPILFLKEIEPNWYIEDKTGKKHKIRRGRFQNLNTLIVFDCDVGSARNGSSSGTRKSKGERKIESALINLDINYESQYVFYDCRSQNNRVLYFDFYLPDYNTCIEYDGEQHFVGWKRDASTLITIKQNDKRKDTYCAKKGIQLIRIPYTDLQKINESFLLELLENK